MLFVGVYYKNSWCILNALNALKRGNVMITILRNVFMAVFVFLKDK
jgi:hypothetical protein